MTKKLIIAILALTGLGAIAFGVVKYVDSLD